MLKYKIPQIVTLTHFLQGLLIECQYAMNYLGFLGSMYGFCGNGFPWWCYV